MQSWNLNPCLSDSRTCVLKLTCYSISLTTIYWFPPWFLIHRNKLVLFYLIVDFMVPKRGLCMRVVKHLKMPLSSLELCREYSVALPYRDLTSHLIRWGTLIPYLYLRPQSSTQHIVPLRYIYWLNDWIN